MTISVIKTAIKYSKLIIIHLVWKEWSLLLGMSVASSFQEDAIAE